jgi:hypothetical protein
MSRLPRHIFIGHFAEKRHVLLRPRLPFWIAGAETRFAALRIHGAYVASSKASYLAILHGAKQGHLILRPETRVGDTGNVESVPVKADTVQGSAGLAGNNEIMLFSE